MKTAVDRIGRGKARDVNLRFSAMVSHYLYEPEFCNPASGWEKGQIEKNVQDSRHRIWTALPVNFPDLAALNAWLEARCLALWRELPHPAQSGRTIAEVWQAEQPLLMQNPAPFDGFVEQPKRVTPTCLVHVDRNRYSVPASFANRPVSVRLYAERVVIAAEGQVIAEHRRRINRSHDAGQTIYDWHHYLSVVQRKPGALRNGAPFAELPDGFHRLQAILLKRSGGDREMVEILALVLTYDEQAVLAAVGIGAACARRMAEEGARVAIMDIHDDAGGELARELSGAHEAAIYLHADVALEQKVAAAIEAVVTKFGRLDVLVNNAGIAGPDKPTHELTEQEWDRVQAVNVKGVFFRTKHALAHLRRSSGGGIINLSSIYGLVGGGRRPGVPRSQGRRAFDEQNRRSALRK